MNSQYKSETNSTALGDKLFVKKGEEGVSMEC